MTVLRTVLYLKCYPVMRRRQANTVYVCLYDWSWHLNLPTDGLLKISSNGGWNWVAAVDGCWCCATRHKSFWDKQSSPTSRDNRCPLLGKAASDREESRSIKLSWDSKGHPGTQTSHHSTLLEKGFFLKGWRSTQNHSLLKNRFGKKCSSRVICKRFPLRTLFIHVFGRKSRKSWRNSFIKGSLCKSLKRLSEEPRGCFLHEALSK